MHGYDSGIVSAVLAFLFDIRRAGTETLDVLTVFTSVESPVPWVNTLATFRRKNAFSGIDPVP
jgi:hypothetical protein